ncbi:MAG: histidine kinase [Burkholderiaceae bacterium]
MQGATTAMVTQPAGKAVVASGSQSEQARARRQSDGAALPLLPDCCNLGTILRVLFVLCVGSAATALVTAPSLLSAAGAFADIVLMTVPAALVSLAALCPLRKWVNGQARQVQWTVGLGVPVLATMVTGFGLVQILKVGEPAQGLAWWLGVRAVTTALVAVALIEWLYLRNLSLQPAQAEGRLQALQARIRPHFLFNSLNTVLGLMRSDARQAERTLENLADLFRVFMKDSRELVPLDEEVLLCKEYLSIEKLRLAERLSVSWEIEDMPGDALLPSLLLQPLVENAVHHGIEPRSESGRITITIAKSGDRVRVDIVNPMSDTPPTRPGNQMALSNIRERLSLTFDVEGQLNTAVDDGQFRATVTFPYRQERRRRNVRSNFDTDR